MTFSAIHPATMPEIFDAMYLAGFGNTPGKVTFSGHDRNENWDVQAAKGQTGATSVHGGKPVGTFQASFTVACDRDNDDGTNDYDRLTDLVKFLASLVSGPQAKNVACYHPDLVINGYTEVSVESIGGIVRNDRGEATLLVKFIENRPPKPKKAQTAKSTGGASGAGGKPAKPDPNAEAKKELNRLVDEAKKP